jgi:hypothetical protein
VNVVKGVPLEVGSITETTFEISHNFEFPGGAREPPAITGAKINYTYFIGDKNPIDP